jgi:hypothetical protein
MPISLPQIHLFLVRSAKLGPCPSICLFPLSHSSTNNPHRMQIGFPPPFSAMRAQTLITSADQTFLLAFYSPRVLCSQPSIRSRLCYFTLRADIPALPIYLIYLSIYLSIILYAIALFGQTRNRASVLPLYSTQDGHPSSATSNPCAAVHFACLRVHQRRCWSTSGSGCTTEISKTEIPTDGHFGVGS